MGVYRHEDGRATARRVWRWVCVCVHVSTCVYIFYSYVKVLVSVFVSLDGFDCFFNCLVVKTVSGSILVKTVLYN